MSDLIKIFFDAFRCGWQQGLRGYFAPLHRRPWQLAWRIWRRPQGDARQATIAWFRAVDHIIVRDSRKRQRAIPAAGAK